MFRVVLVVLSMSLEESSTRDCFVLSSGFLESGLYPGPKKGCGVLKVRV